MREKRRANPEKARAEERRWKAANPEKARELELLQNAKVRAKRAADPEPFRARQRARYAANPEPVKAATRKWREANKEKNTEALRNWAMANPDADRDARARSSARRRARKKAVEIQPYTRSEIFERDGGACRLCATPLSYDARNGFHIDHIVPIALGGPDIPANVELLCPPCNMAKQARLDGQIHLPV